MAGSKIKNTVQTEFVSKGAKGVEADTQRIGKAQTSLGQGSASAGELDILLQKLTTTKSLHSFQI